MQRKTLISIRLLGPAVTLLLPTSLGCSHGGNADAPRGRLRVVGGKLLDGAGQRITLKGLGLGATADIKGQNRWNEEYFADAKAWGAEFVRLPVNPSSYRQSKHSPAGVLAGAKATGAARQQTDGNRQCSKCCTKL